MEEPTAGEPRDVGGEPSAEGDASPAAEADAEPAAAASTRAVGFIATPATADAVLREVFRAAERGYTPLVAPLGTVPDDVLGFVAGVESAVVTEGADEVETLRARLEAQARAVGAERLAVVPVGDRRVDYERTDGRFGERADYAVEAVLKDGDGPGLVAGLPAYNEAGTVGDVIEGLEAVVDAVVVVDDGSDDGTATVAREHGATVVEHGRNRGYGAALRTLFGEARDLGADRLVVVDADGQHDPADVARLLETQIETDADVVIGSRFRADGTADAPAYRRFGIGVVNALTNLSLGVIDRSRWVSDTQSGFRLYGRRAIESLAADPTLGDGMSASLDILHHVSANDYHIEEVGIEVRYDVPDANSRHPVAHGWALVKNLLRTVEYQHPILILGVPGFLFTLVGIGFGYWAIANYVASRTLPVGLIFVSSTFGLAGVFASFTAIILHALNQFSEQWTAGS